MKKPDPDNPWLRLMAEASVKSFFISVLFFAIGKLVSFADPMAHHIIVVFYIVGIVFLVPVIAILLILASLTLEERRKGNEP